MYNLFFLTGNPAEMYAYGTQLWSNMFGMCLGFVYVHLVILTVLYPLKITSVYTVGIMILISF